MKNFLRTIKGDIKSLFGYPKTHYSESFDVDYAIYWTKRRKPGETVLSSWQKERAQMAAKIIKKESTVIDIGCGDGAVLQYLQHKRNITPIGVDFDTGALTKAADLGITTYSCDVTCASACEQLPHASYLLAFEVLEHIPNPEQFLWYMREKISDGILFSVPNTGYYSHRLRLLFGRFPLQWIVHPGEHLRFWTYADMKSWVCSIGYPQAIIQGYQGIPVLKSLWPALFAKGIFVYIQKK